jgi:hypothetical protein
MEGGVLSSSTRQICCISLKRKQGNVCLKGTANCQPPRDRDPKDTDPIDPGRLCVDGDLTTYNGLLCASGDPEGCEAVARSQDARHSQDYRGRWFRSPHRLWMNEARCADLAKLDNKKLFNDNCAYGFSPDMNELWAEVGDGMKG